MKLTFEDLATLLPAGSIELVGNNQLKLNFSLLTKDNLSLSSSIVESIAKLMQGLSDLTVAVNNARANLDVARPPILFVYKYVNGDEMVFETRFNIDTSSFIDNLLDPTADQ